MSAGTLSNPLLEKGKKTFDAAFGGGAEDFIESVGAMAPDLGRLIVEMEFGDIYNRPGLDLRTRELIIIASCAALGTTGLGAVKMHIPAALRAGATRQEVIECLVQVAMGAGLPTALGAIEAAHATFQQLDASKP